MALEPCRECGAKVSTEAEICPHCGVRLPTRSITEIRKADTEGMPDRGQRERRVFFAIIVLIFFIWLLGRLMTSPTQQSSRDVAWDAAMDFCIKRITTEMPLQESNLMSRETLQKVVFGICMQDRGYELINEGKGCPALGYASCWQRKEGRR